MVDLDFNRCCAAKLLVAIPFHYRDDRLCYLAETLSSLFSFPVDRLHVVVMTNTDNPDEIQTIQAICHTLSSGEKSGIVQVYAKLHDPFLLTWCFKPLLHEIFMKNPQQYTHFLYLEDDIRFSFLNFCYFMTYRDRLRAENLIPAFVRVEFNHAIHAYVTTDNWYQTDIDKQRKVVCGDYIFTDLTNPYMAMFILDRGLAEEYIASPSSDYATSGTIVAWGTREQAAMGLTFENVPPGFMSRYVVPVSMANHAAPLCSWTYHLPNNLANYPDTPNGKLPMRELMLSKEVSDLRAQARSGDMETQIRLGRMYARGEGVPKNYLESIHWYLKAANRGNPFAQLALGTLYATGGPGVKAHYVLAYLWSTLASQACPVANDNIKIIRTAMEEQEIAQAEHLAAHWQVGTFMEQSEQFYPWHANPWWTSHMNTIKERADAWRAQHREATLL